ncbi:phosphate ABC transporter permease PstA [Falsiporphyromonas endometrii]|uniref:Phosphate transport system permease protein PstA n=1 Tax=Falsiporphyromonas endometrii TaxID=1387297 RepID=A0ABV9K6A1_9PORP
MSKYRIIKSKAAFGLVCVCTTIAMIPLLMIIIELVRKGYKQFNFSLFTENAPSTTEALFAKINHELIPGGILNGITGTLLIVFIAIILAVPLGITAGTFLAEKRHSKLAKIVSMLCDLLQGIPSIVIGIVAYIWIVKPMHAYSAFAGGASLAIMMIPLIVRSTEESLKMLPDSLKEAAVALGSGYFSTVIRVLLPTAFGGIFTGTLLAISRVMGETAPLLVTALGASSVNWNIMRPTSAISLLIWEFYNDPNLLNLIWSSSLLLLFIVLATNITAKVVASKWNIQN